VIKKVFFLIVIIALPTRICGKEIHIITNLHKQIHLLNLQVQKVMYTGNTYKVNQVIKIEFYKANLTSPRSVIDKFRTLIFRYDGGDATIRKCGHCCLELVVSASNLSFSNVS
jgi:hypothetical protein